MSNMEMVEQFEVSTVVDVVKQLIQFPSVNPPGNEGAIGKYVKDYMVNAGIDTETVFIDVERFNVVSRLKGRGAGRPIIFTGHMDVVPVSAEEEKKWLTDPFQGTIIDARLYGRGAADMKGGLGAAMVAMKLLAQNGIVPEQDIILVATVDEEAVMAGAKKLVGSPLVSDAQSVVVCEPTKLEVVLDCRGRTWADIQLKGQSAHASKQGAGINAIDHGVLLMAKMKDYPVEYQSHDILGNFFWQTTVLHGGVAPAIVPDQCVVTVDCRLVPGQTTEQVWNRMDDLIEELKIDEPQLDATINIIEEREPWSTAPDAPIAKTIETVYAHCGVDYVRGGFLGTTDGTVLRRMGMDIAILGPGSMDVVHQQNEWVSIEELEQAVKIYLGIMLQGVAEKQG